jgi:hypothetical protein
MNVYPVAPVATAAAVAAVTHQWEAQKQQDEAHATEVLREAVQEALESGVSLIFVTAKRVLQAVQTTAHLWLVVFWYRCILATLE